MSTPLGRLTLLAAAAVGLWLAVAPPARPPAPHARPAEPDALPAAAGRPVGAFGDPRFAAATPVRHAAFSPDGRWLAGAGRGEVRLWDAATGRLARRVAFDDFAVGTHVVFTPDGRSFLALAFEDVPPVPTRGYEWPVTVRRFDAATGAEQARVRLAGLNAAELHGRPVAAFTPDGSGVVLGYGGLPTRFCTATGRQVWAAALPPKNPSYAQHVTGVAVSPDGAVVAAAVSNSGGPFHLLDAATGAAVGRLTEPAAHWPAVAFSADGKWLATAVDGEQVAVWDAATRAPRARLATARLVNTPLALSPAGDRVAVAEFEAGIRVYDTATGRETARADGHLTRPTVTFSPDGTAVAATAGSVVVVLDLATGRRRAAAGRSIWSAVVRPQFRFSADGARVHVRTTRGDDLVTYELPSGREVGRAADTPAAVAALGFSDWGRVVSADGRVAAADVDGRDDDRAVVVTETATGRERCRVPAGPETGYRRAAGLSPDGGQLYTVGSHEVAVWDTATGRRVRALAEPAPAAGKLHPFLSVAASPGGRHLAVFADAEPRPASWCGTCNALASDNGAKTVTIWDTAEWRVARELTVPAGRWLRWQTDDRFTVETTARRPGGGFEADERLRYDPPPRERLVPAPDGRLLAGFDPEDPARPGVRVYEAGTGRELHRFPADEPCRSAAFSPDGRYLLTDHPAAGVRVWDVRRATGRPGE
ncbi:MAG: hypothetical protein C0501_22060 [Isosphaera sp.]|nr:hypothetical protein [Isosphaera sp.]